MKAIVTLLIVSALFAPNGEGTAHLNLNVTGLSEPGGKLWVGIYRSEEDFLDRERARLEYVEVRSTGRLTMRIDDLMVGSRYALAVFHDRNDNGELDRNWLGLPAEPWALSRPLRSLLRKPRFEEMAFELRYDGEPIDLRLK